jgi:hypothetical protein
MATNRMPKRYRTNNGRDHLDPCPHPGQPARRHKKTYRSKAKAKQAAVLNQARTLYPYLCRNCGHWHLTHNAPQRDDQAA